MPENRTQEQLDADEALEQAIQRIADVYQMAETGDGYMLGEFVVMAEWPSITGDNTTYHWFVNGRTIPRHHVVGLHKMLGMMLQMEFTQAGEDDG